MPWYPPSEKSYHYFGIFGMIYPGFSLLLLSFITFFAYKSLDTLFLAIFVISFIVFITAFIFAIFVYHQKKWALWAFSILMVLFVLGGLYDLATGMGRFRVTPLLFLIWVLSTLRRPPKLQQKKKASKK